MVGYMHLEYGTARHESLVAEWLEHPNDVRKVIGSIPVGAQICSLSGDRDMLITSFLISSPSLKFTIFLYLSGLYLISIYLRSLQHIGVQDGAQ